MDEAEVRSLASQLGHPSGEEGLKVAEAMDRTNRNMIRTSARALLPLDGRSILEIGHGSGAHIEELMQEHSPASYTGLEISKTMHDQARQLNSSRGSQTNFLFYDGIKLPVSDASVDRVLTVNSIYFWKEPGQLLGEIARVLKPKGTLSIGIGEKQFMMTLPVVQYGFTTYDRGELEPLLAAAGFQFLDMQSHQEEVESNAAEFITRQFEVATAQKL